MAHDLIMAHDLNYPLASLPPEQGPGEVTVEEGGKRKEGEKGERREKKEKKKKKRKKERKKEKGEKKRGSRARESEWFQVTTSWLCAI